MPIENVFCKRCGKTTAHTVKPAGRLVLLTCTICRTAVHNFR